jgi:hypothetical protein
VDCDIGNNSQGLRISFEGNALALECLMQPQVAIREWDLVPGVHPGSIFRLALGSGIPALRVYKARTPEFFYLPARGHIPAHR